MLPAGRPIHLTLLLVLLTASCSNPVAEPFRAAGEPAASAGEPTVSAGERPVEGHRFSPDGMRHALWVWTDEVQSPEARHELLAHAAGENINTLYLRVYQAHENAQGRRMYDEHAIAALIRGAHALGIEVWSAYGEIVWHQLGCKPGSAPHDRMMDVIGYNKAHPDAAFDGIILDEEPPEPADLTALVKLYEEVLAATRPAGIRVAATIRFFWDGPVAAPDGSTMPAYQRLTDMDLDHLVVMAYRNFAGGACPDDGIICLSEEEVRYASAQGRRKAIVVGLQNTSVELDGEPLKTTFFGASPHEVWQQKAAVASHFRDASGFGGFALHQYRTAPEYNPNIYAAR